MVIDRLAIPPINTFSLLRAGGTATRTIPGLKGAAVRGFLLNWILYMALMILLNYGFYRGIHVPLRSWLPLAMPEWFLWMAVVTLWFAQIGVLLITAVFSIRLSVKLMIFWHGSLVTRVIRWFRPEFTSPGTLQQLPSLFRDLGKEVAIAIGLLFVGLIPVIGAPTVFLIGSHLQGKSIVDPYEGALAEVEGKPEPVNDLPARFFLGWAQMLLAIIPLFGWLLLPVANIYQVIGFAYLQEAERHENRERTSNEIPEESAAVDGAGESVKDENPVT
ncbi:hypothetical protein SCOR_06385 [Sulfidibacter corallicola]|uniref:CysZ protein n=1 Tax=Sulfidibacter corallicola TaxID=2818388 RepID=A0A8A4TYJ7_SULCO|nr:hypothetical protein [Sulfidibacter corallicola]QTD51605.1 hypothetical protein J3U87_03970 [Sulfidibacter corallicola]